MANPPYSNIFTEEIFPTPDDVEDWSLERDPFGTYTATYRARMKIAGEKDYRVATREELEMFDQLDALALKRGDLSDVEKAFELCCFMVDYKPPVPCPFIKEPWQPFDGVEITVGIQSRGAPRWAEICVWKDGNKRCFRAPMTEVDRLTNEHRNSCVFPQEGAEEGWHNDMRWQDHCMTRALSLLATKEMFSATSFLTRASFGPKGAKND